MIHAGHRDPDQRFVDLLYRHPDDPSVVDRDIGNTGIWQPQPPSVADPYSTLLITIVRETTGPYVKADHEHSVIRVDDSEQAERSNTLTRFDNEPPTWPRSDLEVLDNPKPSDSSKGSGPIDRSEPGRSIGIR